MLIKYIPYKDFIITGEEHDRLRMWLFQVSFCRVQWYFMICGLMVII